MKRALLILATALLMSACTTYVYVPPGETKAIQQKGGSITIYHEPEGAK